MLIGMAGTSAGHDVEGNVLSPHLASRLPLSRLLGAGLACAQDYPNRPVKIVVPFPAGGGTDALTRFVAKGMEQRLGQPFIIENRGGAGTTLGATAVARSEPDGYTIMVGTASTFAAAPGLYKRLAYDPTKDFSPIMLFATVPFVLVVNPSLGVNSVKELVALAKSKPGELAFASAGVGAVHHIFCELFMTMTGIKMRHVPYRGGGLAHERRGRGPCADLFRRCGAGRAADQVRPAQGARRHHRDAQQQSARRADARRGRRHRLRGEHLADDGRPAAHAGADRDEAQRARSPISW